MTVGAYDGWLPRDSRLEARTDPSAFVVTVGIFFVALLGSVPVYERSKRRRMMLQEVIPHETEPEADPQGGQDLSLSAAAVVAGK